jgi:5-methyltetrahydropteroyltriglutamate--homocysteine methyltransferase
LLDREHGTRFERDEFDTAMAEAVADVVRWQADLGIDIVSDGEMSKITYSTYVKDRMTGFGGDTPRKPALDLAPYDQLRQRMAASSGGGQSFRRQSCVGPVGYVGHADLDADVTAMRRALDATGTTRGFMNAASPGLVTAFQPNEHYETHEAYARAVGDAMRTEYLAIVGAGLDLQVDCPDLAMARHTGFQDLSDAEFIERCELHVDILDEATRDIDPTRMRMHLCWGNYEGPHDHDIELEAVIGTVLRARPSTILFEAANPRHAHEWEVWQRVEIPADKVLAPGVVTSTTNHVDHPRHIAQLLRPFVDLVGQERVIASTDCGFGTFAGIGRVDPDIVGKKLRSLVSGAELASTG